MVDAQNSNIQSWETIGLQGIVAAVERAHAEGKWLFIWDKTGNCEPFFRYKGVLCEFHTEVIKVSIGRQEVSEALNALRLSFVNAQRTGNNLLVNLSKTKPDFLN